MEKTTLKEKIKKALMGPDGLDFPVVAGTRYNRILDRLEALVHEELNPVGEDPSTRSYEEVEGKLPKGADITED